MNVTLIGHTSIFVDAAGRRILVNPVFGERFGEDMLQACPMRVVHTERLRRIDHLYLTSGELDCFDLASLATLDRQCPITCVDDPLVLRGLGLLGFRDIRPAVTGSVFSAGKYSVTFTASARGPKELGVALRTNQGCVWHLVNTVPHPDEIDRVKRAFGKIDLLLAPYASQQFSYFGTQRGGFPVDHLRGVLGCARQVAATLTVPWSSGFRYAAPSEWVNAFVFPLSAERYAKELGRLGVACRVGLPGDVVAIARPDVVVRESGSDLAACTQDDSWQKAFDPTAGVPPLADVNLPNYESGFLEEIVESIFERLNVFVRRAYVEGEPLIDDHRRRGHVYCLSVVHPDSTERWWRCVFRCDRPEVARGFGRSYGALQLHRVAASVLAGRVLEHRRYEFTGGLCRLCIVTPVGLRDGVVRLDPVEPPDLLFYQLGIEARARPDPVEGYLRHAVKHAVEARS